MEIEQARWEALQGRTSVRNSMAPSDVVVALEALTGGSDIVASLVEFDSDPTTLWNVWAITDQALINLAVQYESEWYDLGSEPQGRSEPEFEQAWSRPLSTVARIDYSSGFLSDTRQQKPVWYPRGPLVLHFNDGTRIEIAGKAFRSGQAGSDRKMQDEFVGALRDKVGF